MDYSIEQLDPINPSILDWIDNEPFLKKYEYESKEEYLKSTVKAGRICKLIVFARKIPDKKLVKQLKEKYKDELNSLFNE